MVKDHKCSKCEKLILPDFDYKAGDKVWTLTTTERQMKDGSLDIQEKVREATVVGVDPDNADRIELKMKNNRKAFWLRYSLVPADGPTQLDYRRIGRCQCELKQAI